MKKTKIVYIKCLICKRKFKCKIKDSIHECARKYNMQKVKIKNIHGYICEKCFYNKFFK